MRVLQAYAWPGNVRQLENLAQRLAMAGETGPIDVADLPADLLHLHPSTVLREHSATRRSTTPDLLYDRLKRGADFWTAVHGPYEEHEITRADLRAVIERGLQECRGNYRLMTKMFNLPTSDYHRLMNFLRKERVLLPFRQYRVASAADPRAELPDPQVQRRRPADDD
jgi:DNA-binding NtrC family response regulator